jgi:hypothetical protein
MARLSRGELGARVRLDPLSKGLPLRDHSVALRQIVLSEKPLLTRKVKRVRNMDAWRRSFE